LTSLFQAHDMIKINRGLYLPVPGEPRQEIEEGKPTRSVALIGSDYVGLRATMAVRVGDRVKAGQVLFTDKRNPGVNFTSPGCGIVTAINRGDQRRLKSIIVDIDGDEALEFASFSDSEILSVDPATLIATLVAAGLWTALRTRPYSKVPNPQSRPRSIFINAMDSNPLAANPEPLILAQLDDFLRGITVLSRLAENQVYVCKAINSLQGIDHSRVPANVAWKSFDGPHPAGLPGTHIHFLDPVGPGRVVWTINYQDVIAVGKLICSGRLSLHRVVALAGPQVEDPRLLRLRLGANLQEVSAGELRGNENRIVSGSVLSGRAAVSGEQFLGRYDLQISVLREGRQRRLFGYLHPGVGRHSVLGGYLTKLVRNHSLKFSTSSNGSERAMVPIGNYEAIMPLDILPTQLLRSLVVKDLEMAQNLGALELDEEDLSLCSYVCAGKYDYGPILRENLALIEKESQ